VNFDGSGASPSIRDDGNVSSVSYFGVPGTYTVNFSTSMGSSSYAAVATCGITIGQVAISMRVDIISSSSMRVGVVDQSGTAAFSYIVCAATFI
jgi:hypothetical protein